jgi:hypothetical protein
MFRYGTEAEEAEAHWIQGDAVQDVITAELRQMVTRKVWTPVHTHQLTDLENGRVIRSSMFLKEKFLEAEGSTRRLGAHAKQGSLRGLVCPLSSDRVHTLPPIHSCYVSPFCCCDGWEGENGRGR